MDDHMYVPPMSRELIANCKLCMETARLAAEMAVRNAPPGATRADIIETIRNLEIKRVPRAES